VRLTARRAARLRTTRDIDATDLALASFDGSTGGSRRPSGSE
jgi:hypothetical protein